MKFKLWLLLSKRLRFKWTISNSQRLSFVEYKHVSLRVSTTIQSTFESFSRLLWEGLTFGYMKNITKKNEVSNQGYAPTAKDKE